MGPEEIVFKRGKYYGYPECCIIQFIEDMPKLFDTNDEFRSKERLKVAGNSGFIPCQSCAEKVLSGKIHFKDLIKDRKSTIPLKSNTMWLKKSLVMLPTEKAENCLRMNLKASSLSYFKGYLTKEYQRTIGVKSHHLYILSDEAIDFKKDYVIHIDPVGDKHLISPNTWEPNPLFCKKVIATSDQSLNIHLIPESFIEYFVSEYNKHNFVKNVMVQYEENGTTCSARKNGEDCNGCQGFCDWEYVYELKVSGHNFVSTKNVKETWNEQEHIDDIRRMISLYATTYIDGDIEEWIKKNL